MSALVTHTSSMTMRHLQGLWRQPWMIAMTLVQPVIWLLLFGELFRHVTEIPGFTADSYVNYLAPGVAVMSAIFSGGWLGMGLIDDIDRGILDRFLTSPVRRAALVLGRLVQQGIITLVQTAVILGIGYAMGARFDSPVKGALTLIGVSVLLATAVGALSIALGLLTRRGESLVIVTQLMLLPLCFVSSVFMQRDLMPGWMQPVSDWNPVTWAADAARSALGSPIDWGLVGANAGMLAGLVILSVWLATAAFRSYQRSM